MYGVSYREGCLKCTQLLRVAEAKIDAASEVDGLTAFHLACVGGHVDAVELLMAYGCDTRCALTPPYVTACRSAP